MLLLSVKEWFILQADMVPTAGGGAQVIFNDVEILKQQSPTVTPAQKRSASTGELKDTEAACAVAVEGHKRARHWHVEILILYELHYGLKNLITCLNCVQIIKNHDAWGMHIFFDIFAVVSLRFWSFLHLKNYNVTHVTPFVI